MQDLHAKLAPHRCTVNPELSQRLIDELKTFAEISRAKDGREVRYGRSFAALTALALGDHRALHHVWLATNALLRASTVAVADDEARTFHVENMRWAWLSIVVLARKIRQEIQTELEALRAN